MAFVDNAIEKKLMDLHCAYLGSVISISGNTATVQPLGLIKGFGSDEGKKQAVVGNVPIACKYKLSSKSITYMVNTAGGTRTQTIVEPTPLTVGDLVLCVCADRNISDARRGDNVVPPAGMHSISDSIIVGIL